MRKTTVFVDETLIRDALKVTRLKTKKEVIDAGLRELIKSRDVKAGTRNVRYRTHSKRFTKAEIRALA